jgi:hypothetical protein
MSCIGLEEQNENDAAIISSLLFLMESKTDQYESRNGTRDASPTHNLQTRESTRIGERRDKANVIDSLIPTVQTSVPIDSSRGSSLLRLKESPKVTTAPTNKESAKKSKEKEKKKKSNAPIVAQVSEEKVKFIAPAQEKAQGILLHIDFLRIHQYPY